jgi:hypothetical protein
MKERLCWKTEPLELTIHQLTIHQREGKPDHVPLFVEDVPRICVPEMVNPLKGITSHLAKAHRKIRNQRSAFPQDVSRGWWPATDGLRWRT